eukprot:2073394-Rhodomonas_salina.1
MQLSLMFHVNTHYCTMTHVVTSLNSEASQPEHKMSDNQGSGEFQSGLQWITAVPSRVRTSSNADLDYDA